MFLPRSGITPEIFLKFPAYARVKCLLILLLSGDIALNPGPINFGFVNCRSIRNKGPLICDTIVSNNLDILALAETHIHISDTDSLLKSVTPPGFQLTHRPRTIGRGGGVGFLSKKNLPAKTVDAPTHSTFETSSYQLSLTQNHLLWLVSIAPQVHVPLPFLMISCISVVFCHLSLPPSSSVETSMSMWTQIVLTKENFSIY